MSEWRSRWIAVVDDESGLRFLFKDDSDDPDRLHIYARHLTTPEDAIDAFFDESGSTEWNERYRRFETYTRTYGLYWVWVVPQSVVRVISCFTLER